MRFIETKKLNDYVIGAKDFFSADLTRELAARLDALEKVSLQSFSIEHDRSFLREVSSVLNVIVSIVYHPHISNKREEVIIRIEQAQQITQDAFRDTMKDSKLWKEHDMKMVPEEVYYHQHIDELRIYENRFITFLVDLIDKELAKFSAFYLSRLPSLTVPTGALDSGEIGDIIAEIDRLRRKTQFIKNTYFYREVSKGKPISHKIQPTNILLKDRLYRFCFKFYRSFVRYEDVSEAKQDLRAYYTILLFEELDRRGFAMTSSKVGKYVFENGDFSLSVENAEGDCLALTVNCRIAPQKPAKHLLGFHVDTEKQISDVKISLSDEYESADVISVWELSCADSQKRVSITRATERELVSEWLAGKITLLTVDNKVYKRYCPVCRARGTDMVDGVYSCPHCTSSYVFDEADGETAVWFRKIRKWGNS